MGKETEKAMAYFASIYLQTLGLKKKKKKKRIREKLDRLSSQFLRKWNREKCQMYMENEELKKTKKTPYGQKIFAL